MTDEIKETLKTWFKNLHPNHKSVLYSGTPEEQNAWWNSISWIDQKDFYDRLKDRFASEKLPPVPKEPVVVPSPEIEPAPIQAPVLHAPAEMKWKPPKIEKPLEPVKPKVLKLSLDVEELANSLDNPVEEPEPEPVKRSKAPLLIKEELPETIPDFESMKMGELRKYAQEKNIKTGGKRKAQIVMELVEAYSG